MTSIWRLSHPDSRSPDDEDSDSASASGLDGSEVDSSLPENQETLSLNSNLSEEEVPAGSVEPKNVAPSSTFAPKENHVDTGGHWDSGPEMHDKTVCDCGKDGHYEKVASDEVIRAPLGKVWNCVFGEGKDFLVSFLRDSQKLQGISLLIPSTDSRYHSR